MFTGNKSLFRFFFTGMDLFAINAVNLVLVKMVDRINGSGQEYILFFLITNMVWLFSAFVNAVYTNNNYFNFENFAKQSLKAFILFIVLMLFFIFLYNYNYSRLFVILNFIGFGVTILLTRLLFLMTASVS